MMLKWLFLLAAGLYGVLLIGGEDRGQLRAGLRDLPEQAPPAPATIPLIAADSTPDDTPAQAAPLPEDLIAATLASVPAQPIRILPAPQPAPAEAVPALALSEAPAADGANPPPNTELRWVAVDRANVRTSPSRQANVTGRVESGETLLVLWVEESGWARVRVEGDGIDGFVHESLLTDINPAP